MMADPIADALMAQGAERIEELRQTRDLLCDVLRECEEYFDQRADAEYFTDSPSPVGNEEMKMLCLIRETLKRAK